MDEGDEVAVEVKGAGGVLGGLVRHGNGDRAVRRGGVPRGRIRFGRAGARRFGASGFLFRPVVFVACLLLPLLAAAPALAAAPEPPPGEVSRAASLAAHLRTDPVYVTDQLPRSVPRSTAPEFAKLAKRTGVPTYVLVLPGTGAGAENEGLLGAVHDRLGRDGLYVLVDDSSVVAADAFGVRAPAEDAETVQQYELPYDAGPLLSFERFVDVIAEGSKKAAQHAADARAEYAGHGPYGEGYKEPEPLHISPTDRRNQSFLTGIVLAVLPLLVLLLAPYVRRWSWGRRSAAPAPAPTSADLGAARASKGPAPSTARFRWVVASVVAALAGLVALTTTLLFDQTTSSAAPPPTGTDMTARVERVVDGLRRDPVYTDPESPRVLSGQRMDELRKRVGEFERGSVYVALVPQLPEDESAGEAEAFADALHARLDKPGVYVVADPLAGEIDVITYHVRIDANLIAFDVPDSIRYGDTDDRSDGHQLGERLDRLMTFLDKAPRTDPPETSSYGDAAPDAVEERALPRLFSGDFWPGLMVGAFGALLVFGVVAGVLGVVRRATRRGVSDGRPPVAGVAFEAPADPSASYLRAAAREELDALAREFDPDAALPSALRTRIWDCLDTATLLADRAGAERDAAGPDGRVDDDVPPADLAAAVTLARMGRAALATGDTSKPSCALNPLHGPATGWRDAQYAPEDSRRRTLPVCATCRAFVTEDPGRAHTLRLTLPGPGRGRNGGGRVPYEDVAGPLPAARKGVPQLIRKVREYAGVQ
ncbi:hypothetical protein ABZ921_37125 [Streptomyces atriruber]|uniref:TPM domain-containing protein n=1 Tax=Streptomyces atriruber TaxID=545121 RepID=A0ABV3BZ25_9ACTN